METLKIIQGEDRVIELVLRYDNGNPYPLTGVTEITVRFKKTDGTTLSATLTGTKVLIVSTEGGQISISLTDTETATLKLGSNPVTVVIDVNTARRIVNIPNAIQVVIPTVS